MLTPPVQQTPGLPPDVNRRLRELVERRAGLVLDDRRDEALAEAVAELAGQHGLAGPEAVLALVERDPAAGGPFDQLVSRLVVGETHFFRNRPHFRALIDVVLPELFEEAAGRRRLTVWSAGCSTGEEAWSLAMAIFDVAERTGVALDRWDVRILGSDVSAAALAVAQRGEYGSYSFRGVTPEEIARHFEPLADGRWRVRGRYRRFVDFRALNLVTERFPDPTGPLHDLDLIVCRNVTIYFGPETTRQLADRFHDTLREGGYLLVGHAEHSLETYRRFETRALPEVILYQRGGDRPHPEVAPGAAWIPHRAPEVAPRRALRPPGRSRRLLAADVPVGDAGPAGVEAALLAVESGDLNAAVERAVAALEANPEDAGACLLLGRVAADRGHAREAAIWIRRALDLSPISAEGHYLLALLCAEARDPREALRSLERATYLEPDLVVAHVLRARLLRELGQQRQADHSLTVARRLLADRPADEPVPLSQEFTVAQYRALLGERP